MDLQPSLKAALVKQVTTERFNEVSYIQLGNWADSEGYDGLAAFCDKSAEDEREHAQKFIRLLRDRCDMFQLEALGAPKSIPDSLTFQDAIDAMLMLEQSTTISIDSLMALAMRSCDGSVMQVLMWFQTEQAKSEKELTTYLQKAQRADNPPSDWLDEDVIK